jgi:hypothetical protein
VKESASENKEENKNKWMLRQAQHETRRALQPELVEGKLSTYFLSVPKP